jgi:hypothetical protein
VHRNLRIFEKLCGTDPLHSVIMAITSWEFLGDLEAAMLREEEMQAHDEHWGLMIKRGSSVLRYTGDNDSAMRILGTLVPSDSTQPASGHQMEPHERKRGFSESGTRIEFQSAEAEVNQLLTKYTTVFEIPPAQQRRWTMDYIH